jgi:hypothetical protein
MPLPTWQGFKQGAHNVGTRIRDAFSHLGGRVKNFFGSIPTRIRRAATRAPYNIAGNAVQVGGRAAQGVMNGVSAMMGDYGAPANLMGQAINGTGRLINQGLHYLGERHANQFNPLPETPGSSLGASAAPQQPQEPQGPLPSAVPQQGFSPMRVVSNLGGGVLGGIGRGAQWLGNQFSTAANNVPENQKGWFTWGTDMVGQGIGLAGQGASWLGNWLQGGNQQQPEQPQQQSMQQQQPMSQQQPQQQQPPEEGGYQ